MILTIGDSFTYGDELESRETQAWPYVLGNMANWSVTNIGKSNGSNDMMFRVAVEETAKKRYNAVVVAWSDPSRFETIVNGNIESVSAVNPSLDWIEDSYKYSYDDEYAHRKWYVQVLALQEYFKSIRQPYLFVTVSAGSPNYTFYRSKFNSIISKIDFKYFPGWPFNGMLSWQGQAPKGPGGHPLAAGHQAIAEKIYRYLTVCQIYQTS